MTMHQDAIIDCIYTIFSLYTYDKIMSDKGAPIREMIKNCFIRSYDEFTPDGRCKWLNFDRYKTFMRWSRRAIDALGKAGSKKPYDIVREDLHFEHITPNAVIFDRLMEKKKANPYNPIPKNEIASILNASEIVILSKEESDILDGSKKTEYPLEEEKMYGVDMKSKEDGSVRLDAIKAELKPFKEWSYEHNKN